MTDGKQPPSFNRPHEDQRGGQHHADKRSFAYYYAKQLINPPAKHFSHTHFLQEDEKILVSNYYISNIRRIKMQNYIFLIEGSVVPEIRFEPASRKC